LFFEAEKKNSFVMEEKEQNIWNLLVFLLFLQRRIL